MPLLQIQGQWYMKQQDSGSAGGGGGSGIPVYLKKIRQNTQNSSKYTQNYTQVYLIPEIQRKWYTEYPYLSCNIPYTRFKKPLYTVYPKTLADPKDSYQSLLKYWSLFFISPETNMFVSFTKRKKHRKFSFSSWDSAHDYRH